MYGSNLAFLREYTLEFQEEYTHVNSLSSYKKNLVFYYLVVVFTFFFFFFLLTDSTENLIKNMGPLSVKILAHTNIYQPVHIISAL